MYDQMIVVQVLWYRPNDKTYQNILFFTLKALQKENK